MQKNRLFRAVFCLAKKVAVFEQFKGGLLFDVVLYCLCVCVRNTRVNLRLKGVFFLGRGRDEKGGFFLERGQRHLQPGRF